MKKCKIEKLLIANRGEIAARIQRAARSLGIPSATICSETDRASFFARHAEELVIIGPGPAKDSYLAVDKILQAAKDRGCNAIHPGYGFLSENAGFAAAVQAAGLIFVGPSAKSIELLGSKTRSKELARQAGVACAPNTAGDLSDAELLEAAPAIGFPVLVKAVGGGGGRGMRLAQNAKELSDILPRARSEAEKFFGDSRIYLEKFIDRPRHVEVQILGDMQGNLIHLGTRDCSVQRRNQKLIEEAPAPLLSSSLRERLHSAALAVGKAADYFGAGTVEFLVKDDDYYFLEVNTRIQVEHPVTEAITGLDLVALQLQVAQGEKLPLTQSQVQFSGHAIEFRICAEDPFNGFAPSGGKIEEWTKPEGVDFREDSGFEAGDSVPLLYDSMIAKVVVNGRSRAENLDKSLVVLRGYVIQGVPTTVALHLWVLYNRLFREGPIDIGFVEREFSAEARSLLRAAESRDPRWVAPVGTKGPVGGMEVKNFYEYRSERFDTTYTIEIIHKRDGFFLAVPVDSSGRRGKNSSCRISNGLNTVMTSLINDVLEQRSPSEIFN